MTKERKIEDKVILSLYATPNTFGPVSSANYNKIESGKPMV